MNDSQRRVLEFLKTYRSPHTKECTPSIKEIALGVGLSRGHVQTILGKLVANGQIEKNERWESVEEQIPGLMARRSNLYKVLGSILIVVCLFAASGTRAVMSTNAELDRFCGKACGNPRCYGE